MLSLQGLLKMSHVKLILTQLAEFHSTSYHLIQTHEGGLEKFREEFPHINEKIYIKQSEDMNKTFEGGRVQLRQLSYRCFDCSISNSFLARMKA